ncbi:MAG: transglutaminase domain-containing protein [Actinomycetota bacterium]
MPKKAYILILPLVCVLLVSCMAGQQEPARDLHSEDAAVEPPPEEEKFGSQLSFSQAGKLEIPGQAIDVDIKGTYAYLTDDLGQLYIIDFSDKGNPQVLGKARDIHSANIVIIQDDYAYVSYTSWQSEEDKNFTECGLKIIDAREIESPMVVGDYVSGSGREKWVLGIFIQGDYAYLNTTEQIGGEPVSRMEIVDIGDKENPAQVSALDLDGMPWSVYVQDNFAYINTAIYDESPDPGQQGRLLVADVTDKEEPQLTGSCELPPGTAGVYVEDDFAYISNNTLEFESGEAESYLQLVDITDKNNPRAVSRCLLPGQGWEIDMVSDYVLVSDLDGGVHAVDISQKESPRLANSFYTSGTSYDVTIEGNYGYIADGFSGLAVLALSGQEDRRDIASQEGNRAPNAYFEISGDGSGPGEYPVGVPVYFSAAPSYDADGDQLSYSWEIGVRKYEGKDISHVFDIPGNYEVKLTVGDGELSDETAGDITIRESSLCVVPVRNRNLEVEIEYRITNLGPGTLKGIQCFATIPQTYKPFQVVNELKTVNEDYQIVYDQSNNKILQIDYGDLEVGEAEEMTQVLLIDVDMRPFEYMDLDYGSLDYDEDDSDLFFYTMDDLYIDSDNPVIIDRAKSVIGDEERPVAIMEKLYYYVTNLLHYDFRRAEDPRYPLMYASEILQEKKGVCADYAILYTALLRAAGIPSRVASGIPLYATLLEGGQLDIGHAWVEVKFPQFGWVPIDITIEDPFMAPDYNMNLATERGSGFLHRNITMDWSSYYFDGFVYSWEGEDMPEVEQSITYRVRE